MLFQGKIINPSEYFIVYQDNKEEFGFGGCMPAQYINAVLMFL
jgi:hypothetical protein